MRNLALGLLSISSIGYALTVAVAEGLVSEGLARTSLEPSDRQTNGFKALASYLLSAHPVTIRRVGHESLGLSRSPRAPGAVNILGRLFGVAVPTKDERTLGDFSVQDIDGKIVDLKDYMGDVVLITNVASR
jgi:hypothetical protein